LRTNQRADLDQGCANLRVCDQGTLSCPPSASDALLLSAIPVASHLNIKNKVTGNAGNNEKLGRMTMIFKVGVSKCVIQ
jgi:hypothetical protein